MEAFLPLPERIWNSFCTKCGASDEYPDKPAGCACVCKCGYARLVIQSNMYTEGQMTAYAKAHIDRLLGVRDTKTKEGEHAWTCNLRWPGTLNTEDDCCDCYLREQKAKPS